jgi:hypothetical protein
MMATPPTRSATSRPDGARQRLMSYRVRAVGFADGQTYPALPANGSRALTNEAFDEQGN